MRLLNYQVDRLGAFALLVRFNLKCNTLSFGQILQSCPFHGRDMNEHVAAAVIGLDEAIATFSVEEFDRTSHGHRVLLPRMLKPMRAIAHWPDRTSRPESLA